jgi:adenylate cyclase
MAMWGAPAEDQADHARRASHAALAMRAQLPRLNARWQAELQEELKLGIGINTGIAQVGNVGSKHKFKYGPLGHPVNLASRIQGATKFFSCPLLISGTTQAKLDSSFATRRLGCVRVVNIDEAVVLYELVPSGQADWPEARIRYEEALQAFENKHFLQAAQILGNWLMPNRSDAPALVLLSRAVQCLVDEPVPFDPVWVLPGK